MIRLFVVIFFSTSDEWASMNMQKDDFTYTVLYAGGLSIMHLSAGTT